MKIEDVLDVVLEEDYSVMHGGVAFVGETVGDFLWDLGWPTELKITTIDELNEALKECGILPITETT